MDVKTLHTILREEKTRLGIVLRHKVKPYRGILPIEGTVLLGTDDVFQLTVDRGTIKLLYHQDKLQAFSDVDGRLMIRHELCHVLDRIEGKIGHEFFGWKPGGPYLFEGELMNGLVSETVRSYYEYSMAKRYISIFGHEDFQTQNEIGMEEFLAYTHDLVADLRRYDNKLAAFSLFGIIFGLFKEAVKVYFYKPRDLRFPGGVWDLVEWLCQDFGYLDGLDIKWADKASLLGFEALAVFENFDIASALGATVKPGKEVFSCRLFETIGKTTSQSHTLLGRWVFRFNTVSGGQ